VRLMGVSWARQITALVERELEKYTEYEEKPLIRHVLLLSHVNHARLGVFHRTVRVLFFLVQQNTE
jgi:hypothetical protein